MKILLLTVSFFLTGLAGIAQQNNFVYVQSDNKQPFYIKINDKVYSSSASGYTIIPKLQKGDYTFLVGFPKNEFPQQSIPVAITGDAGFALKNFEEKGWGLYNMQTMSIAMAGSAAPSPTASAPVKKDEVVVTTPAVTTTPVSEPVKTEDNPVVQTTKTPEVQLVTPTSSPVAENKISQISNIKDNSGRAIVYVDKTAGNDTVRVFIPYDQQSITSTPVAKKNETKSTPKQEGDKKFLDIELANPNSNNTETPKAEVKDPVVTATATTKTPEVVQTKPVATQEPVTSTPVVTPTPAATTPVVTSTPTKPLTINSDCRSLATDDDFLKIRKKMAAEDNDDDMIIAAKKMFKQKCYSTEQIKNLSVLFLKDKGRYAFFDAAYPFIHDTQNFGTLESQLSDTYYITRFKAMIRN